MIAGMLAGFGLAVYYIATRYPFFQAGLGLNPADWAPWFGIEPISSGVFAVPVGFATMIIVSLCTPKPPPETAALVDFVRMPEAPGREHLHVSRNR